MKHETKLPSSSDCINYTNYTKIIEQARERNLEKRRLFIPEKQPIVRQGTDKQ